MLFDADRRAVDCPISARLLPLDDRGRKLGWGGRCTLCIEVDRACCAVYGARRSVFDDVLRNAEAG